MEILALTNLRKPRASATGCVDRKECPRRAAVLLLVAITLSPFWQAEVANAEVRVRLTHATPQGWVKHLPPAGLWQSEATELSELVPFHNLNVGFQWWDPNGPGPKDIWDSGGKVINSYLLATRGPVVHVYVSLSHAEFVKAENFCPPVTSDDLRRTRNVNMEANFDGRPAWHCHNDVSGTSPPYKSNSDQWRIDLGNGIWANVSMEAAGNVDEYNVDGGISAANAFVSTFHLEVEPVPGAAAPASDSSGVEQVPWAVVVGGGIAVAAAAIIIRRQLRNKGKGGVAKSPQPQTQSGKAEPVGYILQLSAKVIQLDPRRPVNLQVTAWRVEAGGYRQAPEAVLQIAPQTYAAGLEITPAAGQGSLTATIWPSQPLPVPRMFLSVTAAAGGKVITETVEIQDSSTDLNVAVDGEREVFQLRQETLYAYAARYDASARAWHFGDMVVWFTRPGSDQPVPPDFVPIFEAPYAEPALPGLRIDGPTTTDNLTWHFKLSLESGTELDEEWLFDDGHVNVTVVCREGASAV